MADNPLEPKNPKDWIDLYVQIGQTFTPHKPIKDSEAFVGRLDLIAKVADAAMLPGKQVLIYGERGIGKSSFANTLKFFLENIRGNVWSARHVCDSDSTFASIWADLLKGFTWGGQSAARALGARPTAQTVFDLIQSLPGSWRRIFIIDEFDRVQNERTRVLFADLLKKLSDDSEDCTVVIVGVARTVRQLFEGHASLPRAVQQIHMRRMSPSELRELVEVRLKSLGMKADDDVITTIVSLSQGFAGYTHLLALHAARAAAARRSMRISTDDLNKALEEAVQEAEESAAAAYQNAVYSPRAGNQYRQVLLACALAECDERGRFSPGAVAAPLSKILGRKAVITSFSRNLAQFCDEDRGPALVREGTPKAYLFHFDYALLRPYVIVRGLSEKMIRPQQMKAIISSSA